VNSVYTSYDYGVEYVIDHIEGNLVFTDPVPNGHNVQIAGGEYTVPVYFDVDIFETSDYGVFSDLDSIKVTEILPAALGIT
jgi:hypothetical protein